MQINSGRQLAKLLNTSVNVLNILNQLQQEVLLMLLETQETLDNAYHMMLFKVLSIRLLGLLDILKEINSSKLWVAY